MPVRKIAIVIPVFNEEANIHALAWEILETTKSIEEATFEIIFVDDGSTDNTLTAIITLAEFNPAVQYISLSRNFGKDCAMDAGIRMARADAVITMDGDLQHPPFLIGEMVEYWQDGYEVVYAYRQECSGIRNRWGEWRSRLFYRIVNTLSDVQMENGLSDFRLLDKKVVKVLAKLPEDRPFYRGLVKWVGFRQKGIPYEPLHRHAGKSKYSLTDLLKLGTNGLTSFSSKPLSFAIYLGFFFSAASLLYFPYVMISLYYHWARSGWASVIVTIVFFGGLQLIIMGIIGLYLGKIFMQVKNRPRYIVSATNIETLQLKSV